MTIILRLQGLDVKAGTEDIRTFFECLHIPDGGVYIVGGSLREAFIAFSSEKDAQLALRRTGHFLKGSMVTLHRSNMAELEHKLETMLKIKKTSHLLVKKPQPHPDAELTSLKALPPGGSSANLPLLTAQEVYPNTADVQKSTVQTPDLQSLDSSAAFLLGICTVLQGLQSSPKKEMSNADPRLAFSKANSTAVVSGEGRTPEESLNSEPGYVRLFGLPASATKQDICHFFTGLTVQEVIVNVKLGLNRGCLVKFANMQDVCDALHFNGQSLGPVQVEVRGATEKMWTSALQECVNASEVGQRPEPQQNPLKESVNQKTINSALQIKRQSVSQLQSKPSKKPKLDADSKTPLLPTVENIVMVSNLPKTMTKTEIKELFGCPNISHKNVLHLLDKEGNRTDTAFLTFNCTEDYDYAMNLSGCHVGSDAIDVCSITKNVMMERMAKTHPGNLYRSHKRETRKKPMQERKSGPVETEVAQSMDAKLTAQTCVFVRNMPADVKKNQIKQLFCKFKLRMDNIVVLYDSEGNGIGEAVVRFKSEKLAALAQKIHGSDFLGTKVLLTQISVKQMEDILARNISGN